MKPILLPVVAVGLMASAHAQTSYTVVDLHPSGFTTSYATGIDGGQQVGYAYNAGGSYPQHAVLWNGTASSVVDLTPPAAIGGTSASAFDVRAGKQVGEVCISGGCRAAIWMGHADTFVALNSAGMSASRANGTDGTQHAGYGWVQSWAHALLWTDTTAPPIDLDPGGYPYYSYASAASGGHQVGAIAIHDNGDFTFDEHALMWSGTADSVVDLHPEGYRSSWAKDIKGGQQVGGGWLPNFYTHALLWTGTASSVVDLHPAGFDLSYGEGVNSGRQVGAGCYIDGGCHALLWKGTASSVIDLHEFLPPGFDSSWATAIDADGNIVGWASGTTATGSYYTHAILWRVPSGGGACAIPSNPGVNICSPANGSYVSSSFSISVAGKNAGASFGLDIWLDGVKFGWYDSTTVNVPATAAAGQHQLDVYAVGVDGDLQRQTSVFTVSGSAGCTAPTSPGVIICSPITGTSSSSPVHILASGRDAASTAGMDVWIDGAKFNWYGGMTSVDATVSLSSGLHLLDIYAVGTNGELQMARSVFSVSSTTCAMPSQPGVNICSPATNSTVGSSVTISAAGRDNSATAGMDVWLDGVKVGWYVGNTVYVQLSGVSAGSHRLDIYAVGVDGELQRGTVMFNVT